MWVAAHLATAAEGRVICRVIDAVTKRDLPARVYITSADGAALWPQVPGAGSIVRYDRRNEAAHEVYASVPARPFHIQAPAGKLTITIERGKEYRPLTRKIEIVEDRDTEVTFALERLFNMAEEGWYSGEMHVHSGVKRLPAMQLAEDLNVAFPVNAWSFSDRRPPGPQGGEPMPRRGEVVHIDDTHVYWSLNTEYEIDESSQGAPLGGFLVLGHTSPLNIRIPPLRSVVEEARRQNAFFEWDIHTWPWSMMVVPVLGIDTVPLSNCHMWRLKPSYLDWGVKAPDWIHAGATAAGWAEYTFQAYYALLNCGFRVQPSAGTANGVHPVPLGYSRVYVQCDGAFSYEKWKDGLLRGRSFVTNGPVLTLRAGDLMPGDRKSLGTGPDATVVVDLEARSIAELDRIELIQNGKVIPLGPEHAQPGGTVHARRYRMQTELAGSSWIAARCFDKPIHDSPSPEDAAGREPDNLRFAHTAPIYFDDPRRLLRPERRQIDWLIDRVRSQINELQGKVPEDVLTEYHSALNTYERIAAKLNSGTHP